MRELICALIDTLRYGDLPGHLAAWWRVVTGRVGADDTAGLTDLGRQWRTTGRCPDVW